MNLAVPFSDDFERALIVGLLTDPSLIPRVSTILEEKDFYKESHQEIFRVITSTDISHVDSLTVQNKLSESTRDYFIDLVKNTDSVLPSLTNIIVYAQTIKDKSKLRVGIDLGREIIAACYQVNVPAGEVLQKVEGMFANFLHNRVQEDDHVNTKDAFKDFLPLIGTDEGEFGIQTGFRGVDEIIGKLQPLTIVAARPGLGKSSIALNIGRRIANQLPVVMFSLEMTQKELFTRMLSAEAGIDSNDLKSGAFRQDQYVFEKVEEAAEQLIPIFDNFHIDDAGGVSAEYITSVCRQKQMEYGKLGLIIVDYLHIMSIGEKNKVDALGDACRQLRQLGKELNVPVLLLCQLSRQSEVYVDGDNNKRSRRPELTDLRSSGEIEQTADIVMFLYKEFSSNIYAQPSEEIVEVLVRKNRQGRIGMSTLRWIPRYTRFEDLQ